MVAEQKDVEDRYREHQREADTDEQPFTFAGAATASGASHAETRHVRSSPAMAAERERRSGAMQPDDLAVPRTPGRLPSHRLRPALPLEMFS